MVIGDARVKGTGIARQRDTKRGGRGGGVNRISRFGWYRNTIKLGYRNDPKRLQG